MKLNGYTLVASILAVGAVLAVALDRDPVQVAALVGAAGTLMGRGK